LVKDYRKRNADKKRKKAETFGSKKKKITCELARHRHPRKKKKKRGSKGKLEGWN